MKKVYKGFLLTLFLTLLIPGLVSSQTDTTQDSGTNGTGRVTGLVLDKESRAPIASAIVTLYGSNDSSLVTGAEADERGRFTLTGVPLGSYRLEANIIGYNTAILRGINITSEGQSVNVDTIMLRSGITTTEEIEVEAEIPAIQFTPDKKIFNVEQSMVTKGGSATDVMRNIPGIEVDVDGNVSLRGSENVRIFIDGRPAGLDGPNRTNILQQLNADDIANIEIISNPSAKYEAEGVTGIINIVLKKNEIFGYNGSLSLNAGSRDRYTGSFNFNMRKNNINVFGDYSYRLFNMDLDGTTNRTSFFNNSTSYFDQVSSGRGKMGSHMGRVGLDYFINDNNVLGFNVRYNYRGRDRDENSENIYSDSTRTVTSQFIRDISGDNSENSIDATVNYTKKFEAPGRTLTAEVNYSGSTGEDLSSSNQNIIVPANTAADIIQEFENDKDYNINAQVDYEHPFGKDSKIETGVKSIFRGNDDDYRSEYFDYNTNSFVVDPNLSRDFIFNQQVHSVYGTYSGSIKDFGYKLGLRLEQTFTTGEVSNTGQTFDNNYFSWFPSASLSQKLGETAQLQATYSRRIQRPRQRFLNPFRNVSDPLNIQEGNPNLRPEYTNAFELSYIQYFNTVTVTPSIFYRQSTDEITRVRTLLDSNVTVTTFDNIQDSKSYGGELIINANILKVWNTMGSVSYSKSEVSGSNLVSGANNDTYSWNARLSTGLKLKDIADIQLMYFYSGKRITPQAEIGPRQTLDVALNKTFFDNSLSLGVRVSDLFNTGRAEIKFNDRQFIETSTRRGFDTRAVFATLTYRFGDSGKNQDKRKRPNEQNGDEKEFDF